MSDSKKLFKSSRIVLGDQAFVLKLPKTDVHSRSATRSEDGQTESTESIRVNPDLLLNPFADEEFSASIDRKVEKILNEADQEAFEILSKAKASADSIIIDAYEQAKGILEKAKTDGRALGIELGKTESLDQYYQILREIVEAKNEILEDRRRIYDRSEREIINMVLMIVDKVFTYRLEHDEKLVENLIKQAVAKVTKSEQIIIRVCDQDYEEAMLTRPRLLLGSERIERVDFKSDNSLPRGSCVIETQSGTIDSSLHVQLSAVHETLLALLEEDVRKI